MTLSQRQKNITNPYPEKYTDPNDPVRSGGLVVGGANGLNYDYDNERNKWVLDGIQDCFINYGYFPRINKKLKALGPVTQQNNLVTLKDLMAYSALYPQNGIVRQGLMFVTDPDSTDLPMGLVPVTLQESIEKLNQVCSFILEEGQAAKFFSTSTPEIQEPQNILLFQTLSTTSYQDLTLENLSSFENNLYSALIAVESPRNDVRLRQIRRTFENDPDIQLTQPAGETESDTQFYLKKQNTGLDFNEWSLNVAPDKQKKIAYYNPVDRRLYFCVRSRNRDPQAFDKGLLSLNETQAENVDSFKREALRSMAKFANRFVSESDQQLIEDNLSLVEFECRYGDSFRPPAPAGFGVWLLGASIPASVITLFPEILVDNDEEEVPLKVTPSSLQLCRSLISNLSPEKTFAYPLENIQNNISAMLRVLNVYNNKLFDDGVSRDILVKLNLESEILKLEEFVFSLHEMAASVDVALSELDYIDLKLGNDFDIDYVIFNGSAYFQNLGRDINTLLPAKNKGTVEIVTDNDGNILIETRDRSDLESYENFFEQYSPTTLNYILNSKKISKFSSKLESNDLPAWSEFFTEYTYPNPNENSIDPNKVTDGTQDFINPRTRELITVTPKEKKAILAGTLPRSHDMQIFKDRKQRERVLAQRARTRKELYYLARNSVASCDTGLARILQSGLKAYELYDKKARPKDWVTLAVNTVRNDIIDLLVATNRLEDEEASDIRRGIDQASSYTRDPDRIRREIEKYVNDQISGCLDVIGEAVFDFVIDPESKPKTPKKYWRNKINPPKKLKLQKGFTRNFLGPWGKSLKQLTIKFAEQLILSVLKDVISAALGCGPALRNDSPTKDKAANSNYGVIRINDVVEDSNIDVLEIASKYSIENTSISRDEDGVTISEYTPARLDQLQQLHEDVSDFLTQEECLALLDGNSNSRIVAAIDEMINKGSYTIPANISFEESLRSNEQYMAQFQNSLRKNDVIYATLGLNEDTIKKYFAAIGERAVDVDDLLDNLDPKEAFCAKNDINQEGLLDLGISQAQFSTQVDNEVNRKVEKIKDWCDFSFDGVTLATEISDFFANFPIAAAYNNLLAGISQASNAAQKALLEALSAEQRSTRVPQTQELEYTDTDFYIFCEETFGDLRLDPIVSLGGAGVPRWSVGSRDNLGQISFIFNDQSTFWYSQNEEDQFVSNIFVSPLVSTNSPPELTEIPSYSLKGLSNVEGRQVVAPDNQTYDFTIGGATSINKTLKAINSDITLDRDLAREINGYNQFSYLIKNTSGTEGLVREQLADFWITDTAVRRLPRVTEILTEPTFVSKGGKCNTTKAKNIAEASFNGIQTRALNFVLNIGALFRVFPGYLTPDVLSSISHYLASKTMIQLRDKSIFNIYSEAMVELENHFEGTANEEEVLFEIGTETTIENKLAKVFYLILQTYFIRFGSGNVYKFIGTNIFNPEDNWQTGQTPLSRRSLLGDYKSLVDTLRDAEYNFVGRVPQDSQNISLALENEEVLEQVITGLQGLPNDSWEQKALYYLPVPLIIAMQIIYYDRAINVNNRWPQFRFNTGLREARADDALLSAVNETYISIFSNPYEGFPVVIEGERYYSREEIIERIVELQDARDRILELEILFGPLVRKEDNFVNRAYYDEGEESYLTKSGITNTAIAKFRDYFNTIYRRVSPLYLEKYKTVEEKQSLYRSTMNYAFTANFANNFDPGGVEGQENWIRQRAWYERGRILGFAPDADGSLLGQWFDGDTDEQTTFTSRDGTTRELTDAEKEAYLEIRAAFFDLNIWKNADGSDARSSWLEWTSFLTDAGRWLSQGLTAADPGDDVVEQLGDLFGSENWYGAKILGAVAGGPLYVVGATFELFFNNEPSWEPEGGAGNLLAQYVNPFGWVDLIDQMDKYLDPDEEDSLKFMRNPDPPSGLGTEVNVFIDAQKSIMNAAQQLDNHRGSATSLGTLDKAAISFLYYELALKSQRYKKRIDIENPGSELRQLLDYIGYEDTRQLEAGFPVYLEMDHLAKIYTTENASGTQASIRTFLTIEQLRNYELQLQTHPVMQNRNRWAAASNRVNTLFNECVNAVVEAEQFLAGLPEREGEDNRFDRIRYKLYGIREDIAGPVTVQQSGWALVDVRGISGAIDVLTFIEETSYQDILSENDALANYRRYANELRAELRNMVTGGGMLSEGVGRSYRYVRERGMLILDNFDEILELNNELHQIYFSITNGTNPQVLAGLDYDKHLLFDVRTPPNRFSMNEWVTAFEEDIGKIQNAISWRE